MKLYEVQWQERTIETYSKIIKAENEEAVAERIVELKLGDPDTFYFDAEVIDTESLNPDEPMENISYTELN